MSPRAAWRAAALVLVAATLVGAPAVLRGRLERISTSTSSAELLYLPSGPYLRAMAVGHEESLADLLFIWAIQYYSNFERLSLRYSYVDQVFRGAITELDPRFLDAYVVGGMIMYSEGNRLDLALKLYDKGLAALPNRWEVGYFAGWDCYTARRYDLAASYWQRAGRAPGAPTSLLRYGAKMLERAHDTEGAIRAYRELLKNPPDEQNEKWLRYWLENAEKRLKAQRGEGVLRKP